MFFRLEHLSDYTSLMFLLQVNLCNIVLLKHLESAQRTTSLISILVRRLAFKWPLQCSYRLTGFFDDAGAFS